MCGNSAHTRGAQNNGKHADIILKRSLKFGEISFLIFLNAGTGFLFLFGPGLSVLTLFRGLSAFSDRDNYHNRFPAYYKYLGLCLTLVVSLCISIFHGRFLQG